MNAARNISILALHTEYDEKLPTITFVSILAFHARCDRLSISYIGMSQWISILASARDAILLSDFCMTAQFQSSHPVRDATHRKQPTRQRLRHFNPRIPRKIRPIKYLIYWHAPVDFNPRTLRGVRLPCGSVILNRSISILASNVGYDRGVLPPGYLVQLFQSSHPTRDATRTLRRKSAAPRISILTSNVGCDKRTSGPYPAGRHFNPRIPLGM